jgi:hypothetical protein
LKEAGGDNLLAEIRQVLFVMPTSLPESGQVPRFDGMNQDGKLCRHHERPVDLKRLGSDTPD